MIALTRELAELVVEHGNRPAPPRVRRIAQTGFIDCAATILAGKNEPTSSLLHKALTPASGNAALYFIGNNTSDALTAAWVNGTAAHSLDYDDVAFQSHPSSVLVPAIYALAQSIDATGMAMLDAYAVGYQVWAELARRERGALHLKGWHPTSVWGSVAAAAACARLLNLDARHCTYAIALGASQSSGLMANFGSMAKPFHAGRAAHSGLVAAQLAAIGFTAATDAIEHTNGLLRAVSEKGDIDLESPIRNGDEWYLEYEGLNLKKYPTCYGTHRAIDAVLESRLSHRIDPDQIEGIKVYTNLRYATILRNKNPQTALEAKFSMEFAIASSILAGQVGLHELQDDFVLRGDIQSLMRKVSVDASQAVSNVPGSYEQVEIHFQNGDTLCTNKVEFARGHSKVPLTDDELFTKFKECAEWAGMGEESLGLYKKLSNIESIAARELII